MDVDIYFANFLPETESKQDAEVVRSEHAKPNGFID